MITDILLIDEDDIIERLGEFDVNIEPKKFKFPVLICQDKHTREMLGDALYFDLLENFDNNTLSQSYQDLLPYVKQHLISAVSSRSLLTIHNQITNKGVMNRNSDYSVNSQDSNVYRLINLYKSDMDFYANRIYNYLKMNKEDFPLYKWDEDNDINPSKPENDFGVWGF